jgi:hypothetical protein
MKQHQDEVKALDRQRRKEYTHIVKCAVIYGKQYALYQYAYWEDRIAYRLTKQFNKTVAHHIIFNKKHNVGKLIKSLRERK